jgi:LuxR family maltose regulon positive regulatory protein
MCQKLIQEGGNIPVLALIHYDLSTIYYEWNDLQKAGEHQRRGLEIGTRSGNEEFQNSGHIQRVFLALAQRDSAGALESVEQSHLLARNLNPATRARSAACHVQLALALGDLGMAAHWAEQVTEEVDAHSFYRFLGLTQPRLLIAQGRKDVAAEQLKACYATASQGGWGYGVIAVCILQSLTAKTTDEALPFMADALNMGQPEGFIRSFVDAGRGLIPLLQEAARRGIHPDYVGQILAALSSEHKTAALGQAQLVEPLSERELEVLRLVTAGLSNREIAAKLVISSGTAKTHIHNLCGKLGAHNRTEAALRARELGLV